MLEKWELTHFPSDRDSKRHRLKLKIADNEIEEFLKEIKTDIGRPFVLSGEEYNWGVYIYDLADDKKNDMTNLLQNKAVPQQAQAQTVKVEPVTQQVSKTSTPETQPQTSKPQEQTQPDTEDSDFWKLKLRPTYTFEEFVVGPNNRFIHAAALAVAENPGKVYNPLFIYGGVGLGKTHLMQAIGHYVYKKNGKVKILYITSEKFISEVIDSIGHGKIQQFRDRYREIDLLLVDDVQFFAESESTQEEFFHTFNILHQNSKQIILTSDRPPKQLVTLADRLRSRFEWGLIADIKVPSLETRVAILKRKGKIDNLNLEDSILLYVGSKLRSNIRELEGFLKRIRAYADITSQPVNMEMVKSLMNDLIPDSEAGAKPLGDENITPAEVSPKAIQEEKPAPVIKPASPIVTPAPPAHEPPHPVKPATPQPKPQVPIIQLQPVTVVQKPSMEIDKSLPDVEVAFFYPENKEQELITVKEKFFTIIKKHNLKFRLDSVFDKSYDPHNKINYGIFAELCKTNKIAITIFLGPQPDSFITNEEFMNSLITLMDSEDISLQYIAWNEFNKDYKYLNLALDIALTRNKK